jgi:hypothetical protein
MSNVSGWLPHNRLTFVQKGRDADFSLSHDMQVGQCGGAVTQDTSIAKAYIAAQKAKG